MNNIYFGYIPEHHFTPHSYLKDYVSKDLQTKFQELFDRVEEDEIGWIVREPELQLLIKGHMVNIDLTRVEDNQHGSVEYHLENLNEYLDKHFEFLSKDKPSYEELTDVVYMRYMKGDKTGILLDVLENNGDHYSDEEIWKIIIRVWSWEPFTNICDFRKQNYLDLFKLRKPLSTFRDYFPKELIVYRGGNSKKGISWSLSKEVGELFQRDNEKWNYRTNKKSKLFSMKIKRSDILFFNNMRSEQEVVILPRKGRKTFHQEIKELEPSSRTLTEIKTDLGHYEVNIY